MTETKPTIWALFDDGNSCYKTAVEKYYPGAFNVISIGVNKRNGVVPCDLSNISDIWGGVGVLSVLKNLHLPAPELILASPPCESWSRASTLPIAGGQGNRCWGVARCDTLFGSVKNNDLFVLQQKRWIDEANATGTPFKVDFEKSIMRRIAGEACAFNVYRICKTFAEDGRFVVENPRNGRLWKYYKEIIDWKLTYNDTTYSAYDKGYSLKPTRFATGGIYLPLKREKKSHAQAATMKITRPSRKRNATPKKIVKGYDNRSNIPETLIRDIVAVFFPDVAGLTS
jgi:hypothetical protein